MSTLGWLRKEVVTWIEDHQAVAEQNTAINRAINLLAIEGSFSQLYKKIDITPEEDGTFYLPARSIDVIAFHSKMDNRVSKMDFIGARQTPGPLRRNTPYVKCVGMRESAQYTGMILNFETGNGTAAVDSGYPISDLVDLEMITVGGAERYRIWAATPTQVSFWPEYRWTSASHEVEVSPSGQAMYAVFNADGSPYTTEISIEFLQQHPYLVRDTDRLLLPIQNSVVLEAVKLMLRSGKYDVDAQRLQNEYDYIKSVEFPKLQIREDVNTMPNDTLFRRKFR